MNMKRLIVVTMVCLLILISCVDSRKRKARRSKRNHRTCRSRSLVRYQMTVKTMWDKETFPKMFPTYRPPAHWSQLVGRSHGNTYRMWQEGGNASLAVQKFAEREDASFFDLELSQGYNDVLDAFVAPTIETSVGQTSTVVSLDGDHSKVSFIMKIVPSPDWFIGLDSAELCYRGRWKRKYSRELSPFDAGTDQGLTFTAPTWPNDPHEPISPITSKSPDHPASSFFYPQYKVLPKLAQVEFEIISEYRLRKVHKEIETPVNDQSIPDNMTKDIKSKYSENSELSRLNASLLKDNSEPMSFPSESTYDDLSRVSISKTLEARKSLLSEEDTKSDTTTQSKSLRHFTMMPSPEARNLDVENVNTEPGISRTKYRSKRLLVSLQEKGNTKPEAIEVEVSDDKNSALTEKTTESSLEEYRQRTDCQVSEWSEWSPCSHTCGFGNKLRTREVTIYRKNGGANCPLLREQSLCGSMRNCKWNHFSSISRGAKFHGKSKRRRFMRRRRKLSK